MSDLHVYHDAAVKSVQAARLLWLLAEAAQRGIDLRDQCPTDAAEVRQAYRDALPAAIDQHLDDLRDALNVAGKAPDALRLAIMRAGKGNHTILGCAGISAHDAALKLGATLLRPKPFCAPSNSDALANVAPIYVAYPHALTELDAAAAALEAERLAVAVDEPAGAGGETEVKAKGGAKGKRGRPKVQPTTADAKPAIPDAKLAECWKGGKGTYASKKELAQSFGMKYDDVKRALDRHRKQSKAAKRKK